MDSTEPILNSTQVHPTTVQARASIAVVQSKMPSDLKAAAESVFAHLGLSPSEAIRVFYKQVELHQGLPFDLKIPTPTHPTHPSQPNQLSQSNQLRRSPPLPTSELATIDKEDIDDLGANAQIDALFNNL
ncbi:MAG: hypothetical protein DCF15_12880 [Phormidesmis priestleyi]|uniref:Type II toxin-antitoxin system antitoxin, RelB/DinJ family n=1 Tax=Phormidesmis priestleyi TaxID=268141 RepID=A0A2W4X7M7_9CYAN|nr:MAG: hypothetical protein DCF15_12880 [Phormidesmis priestleyi]